MPEGMVPGTRRSAHVPRPSSVQLLPRVPRPDVWCAVATARGRARRVAACCQELFAASIVDGVVSSQRQSTLRQVVVMARVCVVMSVRRLACVRRMYLMSMCSSAVGLTRGTEPHHSNFWPRPIDGMKGYFSSIAGSQGCAAARTAQIA